VIRNSLCAVALTVALAGGIAHASEFGNAFGSPETEKLSGTASATALSGVESIVAGLRQRELRAGNGAEQFGRAAQYLDRAASIMDDVIPRVSPRALNARDRAYLKAHISPADPMSRLIVAANSVRELYGDFIKLTRLLAHQMHSLAGRRNAYRQIAPTLTEYFALADVVVFVSQPR
jgi:hypothetical protein